MGPTTAKTVPAPRWSPVGYPPRIAPDYGRRAKVWTFGAFEPASGLAFTHCTTSRRAIDLVTFLEAMVQHWPDGHLILILDNLSIHRALDVRLWALAHERIRFLFQPTYAPWLNLIEPWWKTLRSLAFKGRRFEAGDEIIHAIAQATQYWNDHRHPYIWRKAA